MSRPFSTKLHLVAALAITLFSVGGASQATAGTRLEQAVAAAAGRAAGTAAARAVSHAVLNGETRFRGPACSAGANALRLRGLRHAIFMAECRKVL
jgi:hypothetical protein